MKITEKILTVMTFLMLFGVIIVNAWFWSANYYELVPLYIVSIISTLFVTIYAGIWLIHILRKED